MKSNKYLALIIVFFVFWRFFLPGPHVATDLHRTFDRELVGQLSLPSTWGDAGGVGLGEYATGVLWAWPIHLIFGFFGNLGLSHDLLMKIIGLSPILIIGLLGMYKLLDYFKIGDSGKFAGALVFLLNSYFVLLVDGGQIGLALSYSLLPLGWLFYKRALELRFNQEIAKFIIVLLAISISDVRIVYFLILLIVFNFLFEILITRKISFLTTVGYIKLAIVSGVFLLAFHSFWILPSYFSKAPSLPITYQRSSQIIFLSFAKFRHALLLLQPHWYKNVFGQIAQYRYEFLIFPALAFLAVFLKRKNRNVWYWSLIAVLGIFLVKGANTPLSKIYPWLFENVPGFSLFRDPTKFFFLTGLSYAVLIGFSVDELGKRKIRLLSFFVVSYLLVLCSPAWLGKMTGTLSLPAYEKEYTEVTNMISQDKSFGRVFWIPRKSPLGYSSSSHGGLEAERMAQLRPFMAGTVGAYEFLNHLREASYIGQLFDVLGVKYMIYPYPDTRREDLDNERIEYYHTFLTQLSELPWVESIINLGSDKEPIPLLKTRHNQDHFFMTSNTWLILGSDQVYNSIISYPEFSLADNAIIFLEEKPGLGKLVEVLGFARIILFEKDETDLIASFFDPSSFIFPATILESDPDASGWWKRETVDMVWWRDFLQQKYGIDDNSFDYKAGYAIAEGELELKIKEQKIKKGNILVARVMQSPKGGKIEFYQNDSLIGIVNTLVANPQKLKLRLTGYKDTPDKFFEYYKSETSWKNVGQLVADGEIVIKTKGDINVVNTLAIVPENKLEQLEDKVADLKKTQRLIYWNELAENQRQEFFAKRNNIIEVNYERQTPYLYKVTIEGVTSPSTLVFSETFDSLWQLKRDGKIMHTSYPVYSLVNGFNVAEDGEYEVYFSPQKHVSIGLAISGVALAALLLFLRYNYKQ